jgi:D-sedoheptulose 7-phosphate isomerase
LIDGIGNTGDVLVGLSTQEIQEILLKAFDVAREKGNRYSCFYRDDGGKMKDTSDQLINVPSKDTPRIQESHIMLGHIICQLVEEDICTTIKKWNDSRAAER